MINGPRYPQLLHSHRDESCGRYQYTSDEPHRGQYLIIGSLYLYSYPHFEHLYIFPSNRSFALPHSGQVPSTRSSRARILLSSLSASWERLIQEFSFHHCQISSSRVMVTFFMVFQLIVLFTFGMIIH